MNGFLRTSLLLASLTALLVGVGAVAAGAIGAILAFLVAALVNLFAFWNADRLVLAMHGAREVDVCRCPTLVGLVEELAARAGVPTPRVYVIDSPHPNAFATGRDPRHAAVAATTGLLGLLTRDEIAGVLAHELGHIRNRDTLVMTMTAVLAGAIALIGNFGALLGGRGRRDGFGLVLMLLTMVLAPIAALIVQLAISRGREYGADAAGAMISGKPRALASALAKLAAGAAAVPNPVALRNPAAAQLYIVPALRGGRGGLFSTHPDTASRIAALAALELPIVRPRDPGRSALDPLRRD